MSTELARFNIQSLEVVSRYRDPQLKMTENLQNLTRTFFYVTDLLRFYNLLTHLLIITQNDFYAVQSQKAVTTFWLCISLIVVDARALYIYRITCTVNNYRPQGYWVRILDQSEGPSRPIRSLRYIVTCTRIRPLGYNNNFAK